MAHIQMQMNYTLFFTPIPNEFMDNFMPNAMPAYSIVYLYAFRLCFQGHDGLDTRQIGETLHLLESDVLNALKYWEGVGLLTLSQTEDVFSVTFLEIPQTTKKIVQETTIQIPKQKPEATMPSAAFEKTDKTDRTEKTAPAVLRTRPVYSIQEIDIYKTQSNDIIVFFQMAEKKLGKLLNYNDMSILFSFYDWLRLPFDVIEQLLTYCVDNGHRGLNYIEAVAIDWADHNINTLEKANQYVDRYRNTYMTIMKALCISSRLPSKTEQEFMDKWLDVYQMPTELILEACDRTIIAIHDGSFKYTDGIIENWHKNNIKTMDAVKAFDQTFQKAKEMKVKQSGIQPKTASGQQKKNRFVNYTGRTWDHEKLAELEQEYIRNSVKGM